MKHLAIVRHAKSSWSNPHQPDIDRPLNERGLRNAPDMGARIHRRWQKPERILSSHARRALHTAQLIADACGYPRADIEIIDEIYEASPTSLLAVLRTQTARISKLMIVGHNPGLTELGNRLCPAAGIDNIPTCGVLYIDFAVQGWDAIGEAPPAHWEFDYPKRPQG